MSTDREKLAALVAEIARPVDYEKLAAEEAARTDPWHWYCRLCGARGAVDDGPGARVQRDQAAEAHLRDTDCGRHGINGRAESGRLLHVWTYLWAVRSSGAAAMTRPRPTQGGAATPTAPATRPG